MKAFEIEQLINYRKQKIIIKANTKAEAIITASKQNKGAILKIKESTSGSLDSSLSSLKSKLFFSKVKIPQLIAAFRQLAVMTNAGISIHDSIREVMNSAADKRLKIIFETASNDLNAGMSLAESLETYQNELGNVVIAMVKLGEESGNLAESLTKLAEILQEVYDNQRKFKKAMRYPIVVFVSIIIAFTILILMVVPKFREIFEQLNAKLPLPTRILLNIEYGLSHYGFYILFGAIFAIYLIRRLYRVSYEFKSLTDKYILHVYLIGNIIYLSTMNRFNLILTELIRAGVPVTSALDTACITIQNTEIKNKMMSVKTSVQRGNSLGEAFRDTKLYESMLIQMIAVGEKSGKMDFMLEKITIHYKEKFDNIVDSISSYIEPILLVFIAIAVIILGLGIFLPMWDMTNAVKG